MRAPALLALVAIAAEAPPATVVSARPDAVSLTVYRAPYGRGAMDLRFLDGVALVTETRRLHLPRGRATVRFEGVAEGIVPVSAIVDGIGTIERNRDARLLSPASLVDGTLGRDVTLTRTDRATGKTVSEPATIVAGPVPGVVLKTAGGIETLRCSGLPETLRFRGVPAGLSASPVLSVQTESAAAHDVTVRLSYLASGFDWRASYVATLAGDRLDLFAWLTLANGNAQAFPASQVQAVAGRLNRVPTPAFARDVGALRLTCYPLGTTTSGLRERRFAEADAIVVTASKAFRMAAPVVQSVPSPPPAPPPPPPPPEDLGDLKLYRVPERVAVSARGQKQVALLARSGLAFERRYRLAVAAGQTLDAAPTAIVLRIANEAAAGLGIALPAGSTALYAARGGARLLLGLGTLTDRAAGETLRLAAGTSAQVVVSQTVMPGHPSTATLSASNANPFPVRLDVPIGTAGQKIDADGLARVDGVATWSPTLAPGARAELSYRY